MNSTADLPMRNLLSLPFVALTFLCWGNYGPLMHQGTHAMDNSRWRPFVCVGLAYFVIAVIVPLMVLRSRGEKGRWTAAGAFWSLTAGATGALGALGIIMAFNYKGSPVYVMPLVFGLAPVVNTFVTMLMNRTLKEASPIFLSGVLAVALGAAGVMYFKPAPAAARHGPTAAKAADAAKDEPKDAAEDEPKDAASEAAASADETPHAETSEKVGNFVMVLLSIGLTALCWGAYGPVLHKGQMKMQGSRLRPLLCVGLAYFFIAVLVPLAVLSIHDEPGRWFPDGHINGFLWSMGAGGAGAIGALGIIMAFNFGGKPIFVMPLVFGCAPIVNTFTTMVTQGTLNQMSPTFIGSLGLVMLGAVTVLVFSPKGHAAPPTPAGKPASSSGPASAEKKEGERQAEQSKPSEDSGPGAKSRPAPAAGDQ